jgi:hypothetical protein
MKYSENIIGPTRLVDIPPDLIQLSTGEWGEIFTYGFMPSDMYCTFFDKWLGVYTNQIKVRAPSLKDAVEVLRVRIDAGRYIMVTDPMVFGA